MYDLDFFAKDQVKRAVYLLPRLECRILVYVQKYLAEESFVSTFNILERERERLSYRAE